jgi:hypothetical protein
MDGVMASNPGKELDVFVMKVDDSGDVEWIEAFGGPGDDVIESVQIAPDGGVAIAGTFTGSLDFGEGVVAQGEGVKDGFVAELSPEGKLVWMRSWGFAGTEAEAGVTFDAAGTSVIVWGRFDGEIVVDGMKLVAGAPSVFVAKFPRPSR